MTSVRDWEKRTPKVKEIKNFTAYPSIIRNAAPSSGQIEAEQ